MCNLAGHVIKTEPKTNAANLATATARTRTVREAFPENNHHHNHHCRLSRAAHDTTASKKCDKIVEICRRPHVASSSSSSTSPLPTELCRSNPRAVVRCAREICRRRLKPQKRRLSLEHVLKLMTTSLNPRQSLLKTFSRSRF